MQLIYHTPHITALFSLFFITLIIFVLVQVLSALSYVYFKNKHKNVE